MKCPYCNNEMREGYIQGARGVIFSEEEKMLFIAKNPFNKKDIKICSMWEWASPAHFCDKCNCLIWKKENKE